MIFVAVVEGSNRFCPHSWSGGSFLHAFLRIVLALERESHYM